MADATAGQCRYRFRFERRTPDANGDPLGDWGELFTLSARKQILRGGETVLAARLEGSEIMQVTVRASSLSRQVTTADRMVDVRTGRAYNITSAAENERRTWITVLGVFKAGGSVG